MIKNLINKLFNNKKTKNGVTFFGSQNQNKIWLNKSIIREHTLFFGVTGKGKSSFGDFEEQERKRIAAEKKKLKAKIDNF